MKYTIAYDLDATLCETIRRGYPVDILHVKPMAKEIAELKKLKKMGHRILLFSRRGHLSNARKLTIAWLNKHEIPFDELILRKPEFDILIDDRSVNPFRHGFLSAEKIIKETELIDKHMKNNCYKPKGK